MFDQTGSVSALSLVMSWIRPKQALGSVHVLVILWHVQVRQSDLDKEIPYQSRILGQTTNQNSFVL